jgi:hypothetical protein
MAQRFTKGINKDCLPIHQPEGTYRHAQNMVFNRMYGSLSTERGFDIQLNFADGLAGEDHIVLGGVPTNDERLILFLKDTADDTYHDGGGSRVIVIYPDDYVETLLYDRVDNIDLNFQVEHMITGESKINYLYETIVYFTDDFNPPRRINIDRIRNNANLSQNDINLFPNYQYPFVSEVESDNGGSLVTGTYYLFFQYEDEGGNRSDFLNITGGVPIVRSSREEGYRQYTGDPPNLLANKLINFTVENIDQRYKFLRVGAIAEIDGVKDAFVFRSYPITDDKLEGVLTGSETYEQIPLEELYQEKAKFQRVKSMTTLSNQLWLGNVRYRDQINYQPYANNISVSFEWAREEKSSYKPGRYDPVDVPMDQANTYKKSSRVALDKTVMAGEVYALYITPVFTNGQEGFAYHIPGRAPADINLEEVPDGQKENMRIKNIDNLPPEYVEDQKIDDNIRFYHSRYTQENPNATSDLGYWENQDETYPDNDNFLVKNSDDVQVGDLRGQKVRHHKMPDYKYSTPDTANKSDFLYDQELDEVQTITLTLSDIPVPDHLAPIIQGFKFYFAKRSEDNYTVAGQTLLMPNAFNYRTDQMASEQDEEELPDYQAMPTPYPVDTKGFTSTKPGETLVYEPDGDGNVLNHTGDPEPSLVRTHAFDIMAQDDNRPRIDFIKTQQVWYRVLYDFRNNGPDDYLFPHNYYKSGTEANDVRPETGGTTYSGSPFLDLSRDNDAPQAVNRGCLIHHDLTQTPDHVGDVRGEFNSLSDSDYPLIASVKNGSEKFLDNNTVYQQVDNKGAESTYQLELNTESVWRKYFLKSLMKNSSSRIAEERENFLPISLQWFDESGKAWEDNTDYAFASFYLVNLQRYKQNIYVRFDDQELIPFSNMKLINGSGTYGTVLRGGDVVVSDYSERNTGKFFSHYKTDKDGGKKETEKLYNAGGKLVDSYFWYVKVLYTYFCLTTLNANLRYAESENYFYPELNDGEMEKYEYISNPGYIDNTYLFNPDHIAINDNSSVAPYPLYNKFTNDAPSLVAGSEPETWEKKYDPWQNFRANDYKDFGRVNGEIWNIKGYNDKMIIHFENALFQTLGRSKVQTEQGSIYIGGGGVLTQPPQEMLPGDHGQAGTHSQYAALLTKYGYFFADIDYGKVYMITDGIKEVSANGMNNFFEQNLRPQIIDLMYERYRSAGMKPPDDLYAKYDKPHSIQPVGLIAEFDEYNERVLLTKHDMVPGSDMLYNDAYLLREEDYEFFYHYGEGEWIIDLTQQIDDNYGDGNYILNGMLVTLTKTKGGTTLDSANTHYFYYPYLDTNFQSWTVSYYPKLEQWVSFHDYTPNVYLRRKEELLSVKNELPHLDKIWRHNEPTMTYYNQDQQKTDYVDIVAGGKGYETNLLFSFSMLTQALDENQIEVFNKTFTHAVVYNNYQCSGMVRLSDIRLTEGSWRVNNFHDMVKDPNQRILNEDMSINNANIANSKPWFKKGDFRNNFHVIRVVNDTSLHDSFIEIYLNALDITQRVSQR